MKEKEVERPAVQCRGVVVKRLVTELCARLGMSESQVVRIALMEFYLSTMEAEHFPPVDGGQGREERQ